MNQPILKGELATYAEAQGAIPPKARRLCRQALAEIIRLQDAINDAVRTGDVFVLRTMQTTGEPDNICKKSS